MSRTKKKVPSINGSSMADISFILLIFFLITTSMDTDQGLKRRLPPLVPPEQKQQDIEIRDRNVLRILVNRSDQIAIIPLERLKDRAVEFILNPQDLPHLPEKETRYIAGLGDRVVTTSSYAISLKNEVETSYQMYIDVQNELLRAYNEVWDIVAQKEYGQPYNDLTPDKQKIIVDCYPMHISEMPLNS